MACISAHACVCVCVRERTNHNIFQIMGKINFSSKKKKKEKELKKYNTSYFWDGEETYPPPEKVGTQSGPYLGGDSSSSKNGEETYLN